MPSTAIAPSDAPVTRYGDPIGPDGRPIISLRRLIGEGYDEFWNSKDLYRMVKGSKGSKKSYTAALWFIWHLERYPEANLLVIKKQTNTLRDSVFATLEWAINRLYLHDSWEVSPSNLRMTHRKTESRPNEQVILFRGMDDPLKLASVGVSEGYLCWVWLEEFADFGNENDFDTMAMSIRGDLPPYLWKQYTGTFNPWSATSWIKARFFDHPRPDTLAITTTFRCNEHLSDVDRAQYMALYKDAPRLARIVCDGDWGIAEGLIYENWQEEAFDIKEVIEQHPRGVLSFGLDFGYSISYNAFVAVFFDLGARELWVFDEMYDRGMTNLAIAKRICAMGYGKETIWADAAEPKSISELQRGLTEATIDEHGNQIPITWALPAIRPALKGPDSLKNGIQRLQSFKWHVHQSCRNTLIELQNYAYDRSADGVWLEKPIKEFDHCLVAGTMVITDHGEVPIEDIEVGDMVLTHLGYRKVLAAGIARPLPAEIWRVEFENGTVLEGTKDHPIMTMEGLKCLGCLTVYDEVIQWQDPVQKMQKANVSSMTGISGPDILMQKPVTCACISEDMMDTSVYYYTDIFGNNTTGLFQRAMKSIISMRIQTTTISPISNVSHAQNICRDIPGRRSVERIGAKPCRTSILNNNHCAERGMLPKRGTSGMSNMENKSHRISNRSNTYANIAKKSIWPSQVMENSAQMPVNLQPVEHPGSMTRNAFVSYVEGLSRQTNTTRLGPVLKHVGLSSDSVELAKKCRLQKIKAVESTRRFEYVYDLTVDEAHDFFACKTLVGNCLDAVRYCSTPFFINAAARVFEAKGGATPSKGGESPRSRRVFSSKRDF